MGVVACGVDWLQLCEPCCSLLWPSHKELYSLQTFFLHTVVCAAPRGVVCELTPAASCDSARY